MPSTRPPSDKEAAALIKAALPDAAFSGVERISAGSTNALWRTRDGEGGVVLKVAYRQDRIEHGVLEKETRMLEKFCDADLGIAIPRVLWSGTTKSGFPAHLQTALEGERIQDLLTPGTRAADAARALGSFVARLHRFSEREITEFERGKPSFSDFPAFASFLLRQWRPLCLAAPHIPARHIEEAYAYIQRGLHLFAERDWPYQHADISRENVLGALAGGKLVLTGVCDFENVQTGPVEYDIATVDDALFMFYPQLKRPFMEGYAAIGALPRRFERRLKLVSLFRALRYIKRSVKYHETHYYEHDRAYLEKWLAAR